MSDLQRITTEYVDVEDRLRLTGALSSGQVVALWLTRRLWARMLPHLCDWLQKQAGPAVPGNLSETVLGFAQQAALASLEPSAPVRAAQDSESWLVRSVDLTPTNQGMVLVFKSGDDSRVVGRLVFAAKPLRQWLGIIHGQCERGGWSGLDWPQWMLEAVSEMSTKKASVLH